MKNIFKISLLAFSLFVVLFSSCKKDDDDPQPSVDPREKFVGAWTCTENTKINKGTKDTATVYTVVIFFDPFNSSQVLLKNFHGLIDTAYALPVSNTITLPSQVVASNAIYGSGILSNGRITWTYYVNDGADLDTIEAIYTK